MQTFCFNSKCETLSHSAQVIANKSVLSVNTDLGFSFFLPSVLAQETDASMLLIHSKAGYH